MRQSFNRLPLFCDSEDPRSLKQGMRGSFTHVSLGYPRERSSTYDTCQLMLGRNLHLLFCR